MSLTRAAVLPVRVRRVTGRLPKVPIAHVRVFHCRYVVYGLWVLVEIALFFVLIVMATVVMCSCKNIPPGPG